MGGWKWLNTKNSTNLSSIDYIIISLSSKKTRKYGHHSKPTREQGRNPMRFFLSRDENNRRQGQDFLGHHFQSQGIPSKNFGEYPKTGNKGTIKIPTEPTRWAENNRTCQTSGQSQNPAIRVESPEDIERSITSSRSHGKYTEGTPKIE